MVLRKERRPDGLTPPTASATVVGQLLALGSVPPAPGSDVDDAFGEENEFTAPTILDIDRTRHHHPPYLADYPPHLHILDHRLIQHKYFPTITDLPPTYRLPRIPNTTRLPTSSRQTYRAQPAMHLPSISPTAVPECHPGVNSPGVPGSGRGTLLVPLLVTDRHHT
jgi:hypothetical protein